MPVALSFYQTRTASRLFKALFITIIVARTVLRDGWLRRALGTCGCLVASFGDKPQCCDRHIHQAGRMMMKALPLNYAVEACSKQQMSC
jgi:hypothetical protein